MVLKALANVYVVSKSSVKSVPAIAQAIKLRVCRVLYNAVVSSLYKGIRFTLKRFNDST